ncbi:hypothetical protein, partial [Pseudomonas sp. FEN]
WANRKASASRHLRCPRVVVLICSLPPGLVGAN